MQSSSQCWDKAIFRELIKVWCRQLSCPLLKKPQRERGQLVSLSLVLFPARFPALLSGLLRRAPNQDLSLHPGTDGKCHFLTPSLPACCPVSSSCSHPGGWQWLHFHAPGQAMAPGWTWQPPSYKDKVLRVKAGRSRGVGLELEECFVLGR